MNPKMKSKLEQKGWTVSDVQEFLGLSDQDMVEIDLEIKRRQEERTGDRVGLLVLLLMIPVFVGLGYWYGNYIHRTHKTQEVLDVEGR